MFASTRTLAGASLHVLEPRTRTSARTLLLILLSLLSIGLPVARTPCRHYHLHGPAVTFDAASGLLLAMGDAGVNRVHVAMTAAGYLEVMLDHRQMSSDPASPAFTADLSGLTSATVTRIWFDGDSTDTLILESQHYPASLQVGTDASLH